MSPQKAASNATLQRFDTLRHALSSQATPKTKAPKLVWQQVHNKPVYLSLKPTPHLLSSISPEEALLLLERVTPLLTNSTLFAWGSQANRVLGPWTLGILARIAPVETLFSEDISVVRELAKRAAAVVANAGGTDEAVMIGRKEAVKILRMWDKIGRDAQVARTEATENQVEDINEDEREHQEDESALEVMRQKVLAIGWKRRQRRASRRKQQSE